MTNAVPPRSAIPVEHTWDTASVYPSDAAWESELNAVAQALPDLKRFQGRLGESPETLKSFLETSLDLTLRARKVYLYANMFRDVDTSDSAAAAKYDRAIGLNAQASAASSFGEPELLAIDQATLREWSAPGQPLELYAQYFDALQQRREHVRSAEVEELLGQASSPFRTATAVHGTLADSELRFEPARGADGAEVPIAQGNINALLSHPDRELRRTAWENYSDAHLAYKNTMAGCVATGVKQNVFVARARRYSSALEAALSANYIPVQVFHNLIATYRKHLPTWHRYWRVRREALGYDRLHVYDIKAPLTGSLPEVPFDQASEWICAGMAPLGEDYVTTMRRGIFEQRWVDKYPNQGKRAGAYSSGARDTHPFILMSYNNDLFSMSTLAHELGHSMHSYYTRKTQPSIYASYTIFMAEVASNFNQALVRAHLFNENSDPEFQIALIEEAMSNFHRYFFIMPTLARFELELHQRAERGEPLTADGMNALMTELFREGYGDEVEIDAERIGITWAEFPTHMYLNFYVFQYATGISGAHALAENILAGKSGAAEDYLKFLKVGRSVYPLDSLKLAGVDLTSPEPVEQTFGVLARYVDRLEQLVKQRAPVAV
ncbi:MAG: oligoendopeptidase F [Roseiflexaceae bacterium]